MLHVALQDNGLLRLTIDRPEHRNALSIATLNRIAEALQDHGANDRVKLVLIRGAGGLAFAAGGDIKEFDAFRSEAQARHMVTTGRRALGAVRDFPLPVVAFVNGVALGGGAELSVACDMRIAAPDARIGFIQGQLGLSTAWGGGIDLLDLVGSARALELVAQARVLRAPQALALGLINEIVEDEGAAFTAAMLGRAAHVLRAQKRLLSAPRRRLHAELSELESDLHVANWIDDAHWRAVAAATQKKTAATQKKAAATQKKDRCHAKEDRLTNKSAGGKIMAPIPRGGTVAVTGSAGFIGGWVVRRLLDKGYRVRACVRDVNDDERCGFLRAMPGYASGRLTLHTADLDDQGCFDDIFPGCHGVLHLSHVSDYDDLEYVRGVCDHMIASINAAESVTRVVVTSSIAAVISEADIQELVRRPVLYEDRYPDEQNPKRTPAKGQGYSMGKVIAQRAFSDAAVASGRWDAITCCPADNLGPIQSPHQKDFGPWQKNVMDMLQGKYFQNGAYRPWMIVDVRDDAECHIRLLESVRVENGERYIAWSTDAFNVEDICARIATLLPELEHATPDVTDPFPEHIQAREAELRAIWAGCELRNDRIRDVTGMTFRHFDDTLRDCVESLISVAGVEPVRRG